MMIFTLSQLFTISVLAQCENELENVFLGSKEDQVMTLVRAGLCIFDDDGSPIKYITQDNPNYCMKCTIDEMSEMCILNTDFKQVTKEQIPQHLFFEVRTDNDQCEESVLKNHRIVLHKSGCLEDGDLFRQWTKEGEKYIFKPFNDSSCLISEEEQEGENSPSFTCNSCSENTTVHCEQFDYDKYLTLNANEGNTEESKCTSGTPDSYAVLNIAASAEIGLIPTNICYTANDGSVAMMKNVNGKATSCEYKNGKEECAPNLLMFILSDESQMPPHLFHITKSTVATCDESVGKVIKMTLYKEGCFKSSNGKEYEQWTVENNNAVKSVFSDETCKTRKDSVQQTVLGCDVCLSTGEKVHCSKMEAEKYVEFDKESKGSSLVILSLLLILLVLF